MSARTPGRPGRARVFTQEQVLQAALELVDSGGAAALTVRGLAATLGTAPNAVYTYFPTLDALRAGLVEHVLGKLDLDHLVGNNWRPALRDTAIGLHELLASHPGVVWLFVAVPMTGERSLAAGERVLALLVRAGFTEEEAARALYTILVYTIGFAALDAAELPEDGPAPPLDQRIEARRAQFDAVPAEVYPHTHAAAATMATYVTPKQFQSGLDALLAGLRWTGVVGGISA
jgi:TetR/AcrR family transcriptional regulator, tetracycline repressor protein